MDSQLTLVEPCSPILSGENIVLLFDGDDMLNIVLHVPGDNIPRYTISTMRNQTTIYTGEYLLATIRRRMFLPDQIMFPGSRSMSLSNWLKAPMLSNFPLAFHVLGRRFEWKQNTGRQLVMYESSYPDDIVAYFSKGLGWREGRVCYSHLTIRPEMDGIKDMIVLSCILVEQKLQVITLKQARTAMALLYIIPAYS